MALGVLGTLLWVIIGWRRAGFKRQGDPRIKEASKRTACLPLLFFVISQRGDAFVPIGNLLKGPR